MNKLLVSVLSLTAAGVLCPWAAGQERFASGDTTMTHGDSVTLTRKGGEKVSGVFVWSDAKAGRVYIRPKAGQAPVAVATNEIEKVDRVIPAAAKADKGGIAPAVETNDARGPVYEIHTMTVHSGPLAVTYYFDDSLSESERNELRALEKAASELARREMRVETLRQELDAATQPPAPLVLVPYNELLYGEPYYDYSYAGYAPYGGYGSYAGYAPYAPYLPLFGYRPRSPVVNVVVQTAPPPAPDTEKITKSLDEAIAARDAAQKQYRALASRDVYDGRGHIVAVRLEK